MPLLIDLVGSAADLPTPLAATTALAVPAGLPTKALQDSLLLLSLLTANQPELQRDFGDMGGVGVVLPLLAPQAALTLTLTLTVTLTVTLTLTRTLTLTLKSPRERPRGRAR